MFAFNIVIHNINGEEYEDIEHDIFIYLQLLESNGQILQREFHLPTKLNEKYTITVVCPEKDSLKEENRNIYAKEYHRKIEYKSGQSIAFNSIGEGLEYPLPRYEVPKSSKFYVLMYGFSSPLLDGETQQGIPYIQNSLHRYGSPKF